MTIEQIVRIVAGLFIMISVALGVWVNQWFLAFTAFVGLNLFQSGFTKFCPLDMILAKMGVRSASACNSDDTAKDQA